jgi:hypothetical protein
MTTATQETQVQIWMILVTVALLFVAWKLTFYRLLLRASLGQGVESLGVKVNISTFKDRRILKHPYIVSQDGAVEICVTIMTNHSMCGIFFYSFH